MGAGRRGGGHARFGRVVRLVVLVLGVWLPLMALAPAAQASPGSWPSVSLSGLRAWLAGQPSISALPVQGHGHASGLHGLVPTRLTRAGIGRGRPPGRGRGQLPAYRVHTVVTHPDVTGPDTQTGNDFNVRTSKLITSKMTATTDWYRNANGTLTRRIYAGVVNYRTPAGTWAQIQTALAPRSGGRIGEKANSLPLSFAAKSSNADLELIGLSGGQFGLGLAGATPVAGTINGPTVTYRGVLPKTDLTATGLAAGVTMSLVLHSASAASSWVLPLDARGLTPVVMAAGTLELRDSSGLVVALIGHGWAADSSSAPHTGLPGRTSAVTYQIVSYHGRPALAVRLDPTWLASPARVFPVTVSGFGTVSPDGSVPSPAPAGGMQPASCVKGPYCGPSYASSSTYVNKATPNTDNSGSSYLEMGYANASDDISNAFMQFNAAGSGAFQNVRLTAVSLNIYVDRAWTCAAEPFNVSPIAVSWGAGSTQNYPGPALDSPIATPNKALPSTVCASPPAASLMTYDLPIATFQSWSLNNPAGGNHGLALTAVSTTDPNQWKEWASTNVSGGGPYLEIDYAQDVAPQINYTYPQNNYNASSLTPELITSGSDSDSFPYALTYQFVILDSGGNRVATSTSGGYNTTGTGWISTPDWTVPYGKLKWGQVYSWYVQDFDGLEFGTSQVSFLTTMIPQPALTSAGQNSGAQGISPASASYTTTVTDAHVPVVGPALSIERDYDSQNASATNAFGAGWSSVLDMKIATGLLEYNDQTQSLETDTMNVTYPDGSQVGFGLNSDGTFVAPQGRYATLKAAVSPAVGYVLTDKNDTARSASRWEAAPTESARSPTPWATRRPSTGTRPARRGSLRSPRRLPEGRCS